MYSCYSVGNDKYLYHLHASDNSIQGIYMLVLQELESRIQY